MRRVLCLLPSMTETMVARIVGLLKEEGFDVRAAAFERPHMPGQLPDCPTESLGRIRPGRYLARITGMLRSLPKVRRAMRNSDVVFASGPDLALLGLIAGVGLKRPMVMLICDIRITQVARSWYAAALRALERITVKRCRLLVFLADDYCRYYRDWLRVEVPYVVIANKAAPELVASVGETVPSDAEGPSADRPVRIGWFGVIRDRWSMRVLEALTALPESRFAVVIAGSLVRHSGDYGLIEEFAERVERVPGIEFAGAYRYPDDLPGLYRGVDMVMACHSAEIPSAWAVSNRYYEACLFRKPLIVRAGTGEADGVRRHDIGLILDGDDVDQAAAQIRRVSTEDLRRWRANMAALPPGVYAFTDEASTLRKALTEITDG